jgi:hypothetical protein
MPLRSRDVGKKQDTQKPPRAQDANQEIKTYPKPATSSINQLEALNQ